MKKLILFTFMAVFALGACKSDDKDIRSQAKESLTNKSASSVVSSGPSGVMASESGDNLVGPSTSIEFESKKFDFGTAVSGEKINAVFKFTNTGKEPLIISDVKTSCGCTASDYPKEPVGPGQSAEIKAVFDTSGQSGSQSKNVTVVTNTDPASSVLVIEGNVEKKNS